jgi:hypothetical protein
VEVSEGNRKATNAAHPFVSADRRLGGRFTPMKTTVVRYSLKPERLDEHLKLIRGIFDQLADENIQGVRYEVVRLDEGGLNFVHIATTAAAENPIAKLTAFKEFAANIKERVIDPPFAMEGARAFSYESRT